MRAYTHRFISFVIQCLVILLLAFGLSYSAGRTLAQDATTEAPVPSDSATVAATDVPTEVPTVVPTDVPTEAPTDVPTVAPTDATTEEPTSAATEAVTEEPSAAPTDGTVTAAPTDAATQAPATVVSPDLFTADFQSGDTSAWLLTSGWVVTDEAGNKVLTATTPNETATLSGLGWPYYTLSMRVRGDIQLNMASGGSNYQITVASDGAASLFKDGVVLGQAAGAPPTDATVEPAANWHTINLLAPGNILAVKVDNFTPLSTSDATLVGMGPIMFSTAADNTTGAAFDDVSIKRLDAPPPMPPTAIPTSGIVPIPSPNPIITAEATVENTAEATVEATAEATVEATAEVTAEATVEATAEATVEATAEATVEPVVLSEEALKKLPPELLDILQTYASGDVAGAKAAAADYFITTDQQQRINVTVWTNDEAAAATISGEITASYGVVTDALSVRLQAMVTLEGLVALANAPEVSMIEVPPRAVSTSNLQAATPPGGFGTGTEISEGVDTTGAAAWQVAGIKGAGVNIAVIDTAFGTAPTVAATGEYACLGNPTVLGQSVAGIDTNHGLMMVQVLCDMVPAAKVTMWKATTALALQNTIASASATNKVIVIAMDLGASISPGDGNGGGPLYANGLYTAITNARNAGKIVIASAGNNTGRYVTLNYTSGTTQIPMTVFAGDTVHISWNDWATTTGGSDFGLALGGPFNVTINDNTVPTARPTNAAPRYSYTVSGSDCPTAGHPNGCAETLTIKDFFGTGPFVIQVQVTGNGTIDDSSVNVVSGVASVNNNAGNIARPADSQDVIAVGSVCPDGGTGSTNLFLDDFSSHGPVFSGGGGAPTVAAPYTQDQVKPDLAGPTHVSVAGNRAGQFACAPSDPTGFNGTSAAAAHVAGMAALLVSNTNTSMNAFDGTSSAAVNAVQNYLQTHTIDNTSSSSPNYKVGYDMFYGAGYTVLGNPSYDLSQVTATNADANALPSGCTTAIYVGLQNPGSAQLGTRLNPFIDINEALRSATLASQCVVVLPGEYVSPIYAVSTTAAGAIVSYNAANSVIAPPTNLWSVVLSPIIIQGSGILVDGFTAQSAYTVTYASGSGGTNIRTPAFRIFSNASGTIIRNSTFSGYKSPASIRDSKSIQINNNTFSGFVIPTEVVGFFTKPASDSAAIKITNTINTPGNSGVILSNNIFQNNTIPPINGNVITPWQPGIVGINYAQVDVFNNKFLQNSSSAIMSISQWQGTPGSSTNRVDEIRLFGNLMNANTLNGPLIHFMSAPNFRFVNNTVVNNATNGSFAYDGYFMFGTEDTAVSTQIGTHNVEIHNNLFYGNGTLPAGLLDNVRSTISIGCDSVEGADTVPVRNNWFDVMPAGGECGGTNANTHAPNIGGTITDPITDATFFGSTIDPADPFRLRPNTNVNAKGGINTGDNTAVNDIFPDISVVKDLIGADRQINGRNDNLAYNQLAVDIGAYELGIAAPPVVTSIGPVPVNEDSGPIAFHLIASGGYSRTFTISAPPANYDPKLTNACGGQPVAFTPPNTVTYCAPPNYHTAYGANVPVTIGFNVEDKVGNPGTLVPGTVTILITPTDDGPPTPQIIDAVTDYGSSLSYQLGPAPTFNNFNLVGSANGVDYPVTFAYAGHVVTAGENTALLGLGTTDAVLTAAFNAANSNGGKLIINPVGNQKGFYKFNYTIKDLDNTTVQGTGTITVLPAIAKEGHYDDDSFYLGYTGAGWTPVYSVPAVYNHTLHVTRGLSNTLEFPFTGTVVSLNMLGTNLPNATTKLKVEFNLKVSSGNAYQTYHDAQVDLPGLSCVNTLNNLPPTNDVNSTIVNYSVASLPYKLICRGFPAGAVQSIRLTNMLTNAAMTIDSMDVGNGTLVPGFYQESDMNITYNGAWVKQALAGTSGGTRTYATSPTANYTFQVKNAGRFVLYTSPNPAGGTMEVCITPLPGGLQTCTNVSNFRPGAVLYLQQQVFNGLDSTVTYQVDVRNVSSLPTQYIDLDAIQVFAPTAALTPSGTLYQQNNPNITYTGSGWITQAVAAANGASRTYATGAANSYSFQVTGATRFTLYTSPAPTGGLMQVCITPLPTGFTQNCNVRSEFASVALWQQKQVFAGLSTATLYTVTVTNVSALATKYIDLDAIQVVGDLSPLPVGAYQQEDPNIEYQGNGWILATAAVYSGTNSRYTTSIGDGYKFQVTGAGRFVLFTSASTAGGTMQVCISPLPANTLQGCSTRSLKYGVPALYQQQHTFNGLDPLKVYTITVTNVASIPATPAAVVMDLDAIQVLPDVVPLMPRAALYDQTDTNIIYNGLAWVTVPSVPPTLAFGGNVRRTSVLNNYYTFQVAGADRFVLYVAPGLTGGTMGVSCIPLVAGVPTGLSECTPSSAIETIGVAQWQQPRYFTGLNSTKTYQIKVSSIVAGRYIDLDAIQVDAPLQPLTPGVSPATPGLYQEDNANIRYEGAGWKPVVNANASPGGTLGKFRQSTINGSKYTFQVQNATRFAIYTSVATNGGTFSVTCTDLSSSPTACTPTPTPVSQYAVASLWQQRQVITLGGVNTAHIYSITVTATLPVPPAAAKYIDLDAIEVLNTVPPGSPLVPSANLYQQDDPNISYSATGWKTVASAPASGGNVKNNYVIGSTYSFDVTGADRFTLFTSSGPTGGSSTVCITPPPSGPGGLTCGDPLLKFSQASVGALYQQPHYFTGLDKNVVYHVLVTNSSPAATKYMDLDAILVDAPLPTLSPGYYEQSNPGIRYTGVAWRTVPNALASGVNFRSTTGNGNKYEFKVNGADRFILYVSPGLTGSTMTVSCIDMAQPLLPSACTPATASDYAPAAQWQQPRMFNGLTPGSTYLVTVTASLPAGKYIDVDAVEVLAPIATLTTLTPGLYQENDNKIAYSGTGWTRGVSALASGTPPSAIRSTKVIGDSYKFRVSGADRFVLYMSPGPTGGKVDVSCIDEAQPLLPSACTPVSVSDYAPAAQWQQPRMFSGLTPANTYEVTVINTSPAVANPALTKYIDLDAIEVQAPVAVLTAGLYQENNPNITYSGTGWTRATSTLALGTPGAIRSTKVIGDSYSFSFQGADQFALYISPGPTGGLMNVCYTPSGGTQTCVPVSEYALAAQWKQPRYFTGLDSSKTYSVTVTNGSAAITKYIDLDAIEISAPTPNLTLGYHEQNEPNIIRYNGAGWITAANVNTSGQNYRFSSQIGNSYSFRVALADHFILYVSPGVAGGTMSVSCVELVAGVPTGASVCNLPAARGESAPAAQWQQPRFFSGLDDTKVYLVTVTNASAVAGKYIDLDAVEVRGKISPLVPNTMGNPFYQENDPNIAYTGIGWTKGVTGLASGSTYRNAKGAGNGYTFQVKDATRFSLLLSPGITGGAMSVTCIEWVGGAPVGTSVCLPATASDYAPAARWQQAKVFTGLDPLKTYLITVTSNALPTQYIDLDAIQVGDVAATVPLVKGWYQDTDLNLIYTGAWAQDIQTGISAGQTMFTKTNGDMLTFKFTGTGFGIFTFNPPTGAAMEVCYKISGHPDSDFTDPLNDPVQCATTPTAANPAQSNVGYALYGLKQGTYDVRVKHVGITTTQGLYIDRIAVLDTPPAVLPAGTYENNQIVSSNPAIVYSPAPLWGIQGNINHFGSNATVTANKGATAQVSFIGTTLIIYQGVGATGSRNILLCRIVQGPLTNPSPQCGSFSQGTPTPAFKVPIAFYGFGTGTNEVVIENRVQGGVLSIDRIAIN